MGTLIVILVVLILLFFVIPRFIRKKIIGTHLANEAAYLHDYVEKKCMRHGISNQEAQETADHYVEDFQTECARRVNMGMWPKLSAIKNAISAIRADFASELDARLR